MPPTKVPKAAAAADSTLALATAQIGKYLKPNKAKAYQTILETVVGLAVQYVAWLYFWNNLPLFILLTVSIGLTWTRTFIIFHDCAHFSFFEKPSDNIFWARIMGGYVITPYNRWRRKHNFHHKVFGNLDEVDSGQTIFFTKQQYDKFPLWKQSLARFLRDPLIFFFIAPGYSWLIKYPIQGVMEPNLWGGWIFHYLFFNVLLNTGFWWVWFILIGGGAGVVLFHLQHAVNAGYRRHKEEYVMERGAMEGSTHLLVPWPLSWYTLGIEFHHIHHLHTGVASYHLAECHNTAPKGCWDDVNQVGFSTAMQAMWNTMWDEDLKAYVTF